MIGLLILISIAVAVELWNDSYTIYRLKQKLTQLIRKIREYANRRTNKGDE